MPRKREDELTPHQQYMRAYYLRRRVVNNVGKSKSGTPLTQERLRELLDYDAANGHFTWRRSGMGRSAGLRAGSLHKALGYVVISVDGRRYYGHRLAWVYVNGEMPSLPIDHRDGNKANNRMDNLRLAPQTLNSANSKKHKNNTTGFKGVIKNAARNSWSARIRAFGVTRHLGSFKTPEAAHAAYCAEAAKVFGEFANFGEHAR